MLCDRCNGDTKTKTITSKKDGKQYQVFECLEGCRNGKFAYSCFGPRQRTDGKSQPEKPSLPTVQKSAATGDAVGLLRSIDTTLKNVLVILQEKSRLIPIQESELEPDPEIPF